MRACLLLILAVLVTSPADAQALSDAQRREVITVLRDTLRSDPSILREALKNLEADDVKQQDAATRNTLAMMGGKLVDPADPVAGNPIGDITIVNFYDTRCPYCRRMLPAEAELLRLDPGIRLVDKDIPILGNTSQLESQALLAAQRQGGYFKLQHAIMHSAAPSTRDSIRAEADRLGLDGNRILRDMDDPAIKRRLAANMSLADQLGIQGTPALIVGQHLISGAIELGDLQKIVTEARAGR